MTEFFDRMLHYFTEELAACSGEVKMITALSFGHLRRSDHEFIKASLEQGRAQEVLDAFGEWLVQWKDGSWVDTEKITGHIADLRTLGMWERVPIQTFINSLRGRVSNEVLEVLICAAE